MDVLAKVHKTVRDHLSSIPPISSVIKSLAHNLEDYSKHFFRSGKRQKHSSFN